MFSTALMKKIDTLEPELKDVLIIFAGEIEENSQKFEVDKKEFSELKEIVRELTHAQKRTETRVQELTQAQMRTEKRVEELTHAQKRTEKRVEELAHAQKITEVKVGELAEAQKNTEHELRTLTVTVKNIQVQLGGLSMAVGYGIKDKIMPYIFDFGKKEFGVDVVLVDRKNIEHPDGRYDEINIYAEGTKNGRPLFLLGECKAQPGKKDVDKFAGVAERVKKTIPGEYYLFMVGYQFQPEVIAYINDAYPHIRMYKSFEFELKYRPKRNQ